MNGFNRDVAALRIRPKNLRESDLGAALQCGSRIETAREPTTQSLLLSMPAMVPMSCLHFISCSFGGAKD